MIIVKTHSMRFSFTVLNKELSKITGTLEAESLERAKELLHEMELSVMSLAEITGEYQPPKDKEGNQLVGFVFKGQTFKRSDITGTLDDLNKENAYKRLTKELKVDVDELYKEGLTESEIATQKTEGLEALKAQISEGDEDLQKAATREAQQQAEQDKQQKILDEQSKQIQMEVDDVAEQTKKILEEYGNRLPPSTIEEINEALDKLMRMKMSSNFARIRELMSELLELLKPKDEKNNLFGVYDKTFLQEEKKEEKVDLTAYNEAVRRGSEWSGIKGMGSTFKKVFKKQQQKDRQKSFLKKLSLRFSTPDGQLYKLYLAEFDIENEKSYIVADIKNAKDPQKKAELQEKITTFDEQLAQIEQAVIERKQSIEEQSKTFIQKTQIFLGYTLFFYMSFFIMLHYGMQFKVPYFIDLSLSAVSITYIVALILMGIFTDIFLAIKKRYFASSISSNIGFGVFGICFVMIVICNF